MDYILNSGDRDYQIAAVQAVEDKLSTSDNALIVLLMGMGKCLGRDTPILMYDGTTKLVQNVEAGDRLMGPDSLPRTVLNLSRGREEMFRVTPIKGESWTCNKSHILSLKRSPRVAGNAHELENVSVGDFLKKARTIQWQYKLWAPEGIEFNENSNLGDDPYFLGLWLGDGQYRDPIICKNVPVLTAWLSTYAESKGLSLKEYKSQNRASSFALSGRSSERNPLRPLISEAKINNEKRIPHRFLTSSRRDRMNLLAGLMDTDGYLAGGSYEIVTKYIGLSDDILHLARGLGFSATRRIKHVRLEGWDKARPYQRIFINGDISTVPVLQEKRKAAARRQVKDHRVRGFSLESLGEGDYYGFEIDGDRLFLLGDFTVTHNTRISIMLMVKWLRLNPAVRVDFVVNRKELLAQTVRSLLEFFSEDQVGVFTGGQPKQVGRTITVGTIQSLHSAKRPFPNYVIVDEAHNLSDVAESAYRKYIAGQYELNKDLKVVGLTATPFRSGGLIYGEKVSVFDSIAYHKDLHWALENRILVKPLMKRVEEQFDLTGIRTIAGDYDQGQLEELTSDTKKLEAQVADAMKRLEGRKKIVWACTSIKHSEELAAILRSIGEDAVAYHSKLQERDPVMKHWKEQGKHLTFISIIKEGFDFPPIDAVCLCCPTRSPVKYLQVVGRGLRVFPEKEDCLVLDYGKVVENCGPLDKPFIRKKGEKAPKESLMKFCKRCLEYMEKDVQQCPCCGFVAPPPPERSMTKSLSSRHKAGQLLSGARPNVSWIGIREVRIGDHIARSGRDCTKITYYPDNILAQPVVEYCPWGDAGSNHVSRGKLARLGITAWKKADIGNQTPRTPKSIKVSWGEYPRIEEMIYE